MNASNNTRTREERIAYLREQMEIDLIEAYILRKDGLYSKARTYQRDADEKRIWIAALTK